jgi:hypothetical protein
MSSGAPLQGNPQTVDSWTTNPLNPHRIRDSRLAAEVELFRELEDQAAHEPELRRAFRAARTLAEDLQAARKAFCLTAPPGTRIERELLYLERLSPWGGKRDFDAGEYVGVLHADATPLERARGAYLRAFDEAHKAYAAEFKAM